MGAFDVIRGRNNAKTVQTVVGTDKYQFKDGKDFPANNLEIESWNPSPETQSNAGLRQNPGETLTAQAQPGMQKAEAVALIWSKKAAYGTYAL
jgi:hypothetical protein